MVLYRDIIIMRGSQSGVKWYGAISPWVRDNFKQTGKTLISDTNGNIT